MTSERRAAASTRNVCDLIATLLIGLAVCVVAMLVYNRQTAICDKVGKIVSDIHPYLEAIPVLSDGLTYLFKGFAKYNSVNPNEKQPPPTTTATSPPITTATPPTTTTGGPQPVQPRYSAGINGAPELEDGWKKVVVPLIKTIVNTIGDPSMIGLDFVEKLTITQDELNDVISVPTSERKKAIEFLNVISRHRHAYVHLKEVLGASEDAHKYGHLLSTLLDNEADVLEKEKSQADSITGRTEGTEKAVSQQTRSGSGRVLTKVDRDITELCGHFTDRSQVLDLAIRLFGEDISPGGHTFVKQNLRLGKESGWSLVAIEAIQTWLDKSPNETTGSFLIEVLQDMHEHALARKFEKRLTGLEKK